MLFSLKQKKKYFEALLERNSEYDGVFYVGVRTTGVFCRPTCPARKPNFENCEFFKTPQEALLSSYRPCKKCRPLMEPNCTPKVVKLLLEAIEKHPEKRWKEKDFELLSTNAKQASRLFKKRFNMTFVAYARARRLGIAMKCIKEKKSSVIEAQIEAGFESGSGFRDAFSKIMGSPPGLSKDKKVLKASWIDTPLGPMIAIADETKLYLLEFVDRRGLEREIERLRIKTQSAILPGDTKPLVDIEKELQAYFKGESSTFEVEIALIGTPFQVQVWKQLIKIPPGVTCSYSDLAKKLGKPSACRAVARANGTNQLALIIPCHRVINKDGCLGGYGGGVGKKQWLLEHEKKYDKKK